MLTSVNGIQEIKKLDEPTAEPTKPIVEAHRALAWRSPQRLSLLSSTLLPANELAPAFGTWLAYSSPPSPPATHPRVAEPAPAAPTRSGCR